MTAGCSATGGMNSLRRTVGPVEAPTRPALPLQPAPRLQPRLQLPLPQRPLPPRLLLLILPPPPAARLLLPSGPGPGLEPGPRAELSRRPPRLHQLSRHLPREASRAAWQRRNGDNAAELVTLARPNVTKDWSAFSRTSTTSSVCKMEIYCTPLALADRLCY